MKNNKFMIKLFSILGVISTITGITLTMINNKELEPTTSSVEVYQYNSSKTADQLYLSDIEYVTGANQSYTKYDQIRYDEINGGGKITLKIENGTFTFDKGIWAHANSQVTYDISKYDYKYFTTFVGLNTSSTKGDGVAFRIYTSTDGTNWEPKTDNIIKTPGQAGTLVQIELGNAKYLRLIADQRTGNGQDHAVYADAKLVKDLNQGKAFKSVAEYDSIIKANYSKVGSNLSTEAELALLRRELVSNVGEYTINSFYNASTKNQEMIDWLINDLVPLRYYIYGGAPDGGSYYNSLSVLSTLYYNYKEDFKNTTPITGNPWKSDITYGDLYLRMAMSIALTHDRRVGLWMQSTPEDNSDPARRYAIFKYIYNTGRFRVGNSSTDYSDWFESYTVEEMRFVMNNAIDDESILWLNDYVNTRVVANNNNVGNLITPHPYIAYVYPNYQNAVYYDDSNIDYFNELFAVNKASDNTGKELVVNGEKTGKTGLWDTEYKIPGGVESPTYTLKVTRGTKDYKLYKVWMNFRNKFGTGAVCGGISKSGSNIRGTHGIPATVIGQPGHAALLFYGKNANGIATWGIDNDVSGWTLSTKGDRLLLGWGNNSGYSKTSNRVVYILLGQDAINDYDNLLKAEEYVKLARVYSNDPVKAEQLYREAIKVQKINLDAWYELILTYNNNPNKTENDYYNLAEEIADAFKYHPLPMYELTNVIKPKLTSIENQYRFTLLQTRTLTIASATPNTGSTTANPGAARTEANYLLGNLDKTIATFSFDGEDAEKIVLSSRFDGSGVRWDYSIDGKQTWKEVSFTGDEEHKLKLTKAEIEQMTAENDLYVHIVGVNYNEENLYKIDIKESAGLPATLYANDWENKLLAAIPTLEWKYNEADEWTKYGDEEPNLNGNRQIIVRNGATGVYLASKTSETFTFTEENQPPTAKYIPIEHLSVEGYTSQSKDAKRPYYAPNAIDGNMKTLWHTDFGINVKSSGKNPYYTIKLDEPRNLSALEFAQIQYKANNPDYIKDAIIYVSVDGESWIEAARLEGIPKKNELRRITFEQPAYGQYVKIEMVTYDMFTSLAMVNLYEDTTAKTIGTFSFDGENPGELVIIDDYKNKSWEYSLDGGQTWKKGKGATYKLTDSELESINENDNIKLRIARENISSTIAIKKYDTPVIPSTVYLNDLENRLIGMTNIDNLEWKINNGTWSSYKDNEPVVTGNSTLYIRRKASGNYIASDSVEYQFTADNQPATAKYIPIKHLSIHSYSSQTVRTGNQEQATKAIDGNQYTKWHTNRSATAAEATADGKFIVIKLDEEKYISKIEYNKEANYVYGVPKNGIISVSMDGENFEEVYRFENLYNPTNKTDLMAMPNKKDIVLPEAKLARYVKIQVTKNCDYVNGSANGVPYNYFFSATMINLFEDTTKQTPEQSIEYSIKTKTNKNVVATIVPGENITVINNNGNKSYTFTKNGNFTFNYRDADGTSKVITAVVDWIDKTAPTGTISYSTRDITNQDVVVTLTTNEKTTITNNDGRNTYTFTENGEFTFEYKDEAGNTGSTTAAVDWINKSAPSANVTYNISTLTNKDVVATLVKDSDITITNNNGKDTYTFTKNGEFTFEFTNRFGVKGSATAKVDWIDKTAPTATLSYSVTTPTNKDVVVTLTNTSEDVTITNNNGNRTYTFTKNGEFTFEFTDKAGNKGTATAKVNNIDKIAPTAKVSYSTITPTNKDVIVTLTEESEDITVTNNNGSKTYIFTTNGEFTFEFTDKAGNKGSVKAKVTNIDKTSPIGTIKYSTTNPTNQNVVATITVESGVTITNNGGKNTYTFTKNGEFTFELIDKAGNKGTTTAKVNNIDRTAPTAKVSYSTTNLTNKDVVVTLTEESEEITVTNNDGKKSHTFTKNGEFTFEFTDRAGNKGSVKAIVNNIDKTAPTGSISYSKTSLTNDSVIATLTTSKDVTITNNNGKNTYTFKENGEFTFEFRDKAGNIGTAKAKVSNIDKTLPTAKVKYSTTTPTNKDVVVTLVEESEEITVTNNNGKKTYTFTKNGEFTFEFKDKAGNKGTVKATVNNIDKTAPTAKVKYSITTPTNKEVIATLIDESEEITVTNNNGSKTHTFKENGEFTFEFTDKAGNKGSVKAKVSNINKHAPTGTITYSTKELTNKDVIATLDVENGITITNNNGKNTYTFKENGEFTFEFKDKAGNIGTAKATVNNIDKTAPTGTIKYSTTNPTNKDVVVTLTLDEDATITNNGGKNTYTFKENGEFTFKFKDKVGNIGTAKATVNNIDKVAPTAKIKYSTTELTNKDVVVTLVDESEEIIVTNNNGSKTYTFTENGEYIFEFKDKAGNIGTVKATVLNINKNVPMGTIKYSTTNLTNKDVVVTLTTDKEVTITNNNGKNTYTFKENGEFTFEFVDKAGNKNTTKAVVNNIDKTAPTGTLKYSATSLTNKDVIVTLTADEDIEITNNNGKNTYTFAENGEFTFEFKDKAGNKSTAKAVVENIDKIAPTANIEYSTTNPTNKDVTVTLVNESEEITIKNNNGKNTYTFTRNGEFTFEFVDKAGNTGSVKAIVENIDKTVPTGKINYSTTTLTNKDVKVTLTVDKEVEITNNNGKDTYTFTENGEFIFEFVDAVGNTGTAKAIVNNIDKVAPTAKVNYSITTPTREDVVVTLVDESEEIIITNNNGLSTYTFTENGSFTFEFEDKAGNTGLVKATVKNINKNAPIGKVSYSTTEITNKDVVATLTTDKDVTITNNGGKNTYTFTKNGEFVFEFVDKEGNQGSTKAIVNNIDKVAPTAKIEYSTTNPTNQDVVVTLVDESEEITIINNDGNKTYTFTENGEFIFEFVDIAGNKGIAKAEVENIDKVAPIAEITYSTTNATNQNVEAIIKFDKKNVKVTNNDEKDTYIFEENGTFTFEFVDEAGNTGTIEAEVNWIDKNLPKAEITYSIDELTNKDVEVTIEFDKENVEITNNGGKNTYTYKENGSFVFEYVDEAGNIGVVATKVDWIDKTAPTAEIKYSTTTTTNDKVIVTLDKLSEKVTITNNDGKDTYTFTENGEFTFEFIDEAGNIGTITAKVDWIDKKVTPVEPTKPVEPVKPNPPVIPTPTPIIPNDYHSSNVMNSNLNNETGNKQEEKPEEDNTEENNEEEDGEIGLVEKKEQDDIDDYEEDYEEDEDEEENKANYFTIIALILGLIAAIVGIIEYISYKNKFSYKSKYKKF